MTLLTSFAILFVFFLFFRGRLAYIFTENLDVAGQSSCTSLAFVGCLHTVEQRPARPLWRCHWHWLAKHCSICEYSLLLLGRNSSWDGARICFQSASQRTMARNVVWNICSNSCTHYNHVQNRLG